jgi:uncharacterized linocin/CFP29 family protein
MAPETNALVTEAQAFAGNAPVRLMKSGFNVNALRTNALLRAEEWEEIDQAVVDVARATLVGIADLRANGLVHPLGGLGTILSGYELSSDMSDANIDMSGEARGEEDRVEFTQVSVPVPITHKDFRLNIRQLDASRRMGEGLDVTQASVATRKVTEGLENMLFNGASFKVNANAIYGLTTHPNRNTYVAAGDFGSISNIFPTVQGMIGAAMADGYYGPYGLYVSPNQYVEMLAIYSDGSGQSALDRCLKNLPGLKFIKPAVKLADGALTLVTLVRDCIDLAVAQDIVPVEWESQGGMVQHFKVLCCMVPRVKADADGHSGIVHATGA